MGCDNRAKGTIELTADRADPGHRNGSSSTLVSVSTIFTGWVWWETVPNWCPSRARTGTVRSRGLRPSLNCQATSLLIRQASNRSVSPVHKGSLAGRDKHAQEVAEVWEMTMSDLSITSCLQVSLPLLPDRSTRSAALLHSTGTGRTGDGTSAPP